MANQYVEEVRTLVLEAIQRRIQQGFLSDRRGDDGSAVHAMDNVQVFLIRYKASVQHWALCTEQQIMEIWDTMIRDDEDVFAFVMSITAEWRMRFYESPAQILNGGGTSTDQRDKLIAALAIGMAEWGEASVERKGSVEYKSVLDSDTHDRLAHYNFLRFMLLHNPWLITMIIIDTLTLHDNGTWTK